MNDDIRIWEIDDSSKAAKPVESTHRTETEQLLEGVLVRNPDMLMPGLTLVGRQTPTDGGILDLLGVDADGSLIVFELKRGTLTRAAVAQTIDYCPYLDCLTETELADSIAGHFRGAAQRTDDEAGNGAVVLPTGQDGVGDAQGGTHCACAGRA